MRVRGRGVKGRSLGVLWVVSGVHDYGLITLSVPLSLSLSLARALSLSLARALSLSVSLSLSLFLCLSRFSLSLARSMPVWCMWPKGQKGEKSARPMEASGGRQTVPLQGRSLQGV
jgi:hypothetical protein